MKGPILNTAATKEHAPEIELLITIVKDRVIT